MIAEPLDVDFYTTGETPTAEEFAMISEYIKLRKKWIKAGYPPLQKEYKMPDVQFIRVFSFTK